PQLLPKTIPLPSTTGLIEIAAGELHTCTHHADGSLWCAGLGADGEIGDGSNVDRATPVLVLTGLTTGATKAPAAPAPFTLLLAPARAAASSAPSRAWRRV